MSLLVGAEVDGRSLDRDELLIFLLTLLVAGNETTRTLISGGTLTLFEHPDQRADLVADPSLDPGRGRGVPALGHADPGVRPHRDRRHRDRRRRGEGARLPRACSTRRATATKRAFGPTANVFDIRRDANPPHLAFGFGEHLCLGAALARMETRILFEEMLARHPDYVVAGEPQWVASSLVRGMDSMPLAWERVVDERRRAHDVRRAGAEPRRRRHRSVCSTRINGGRGARSSPRRACAPSSSLQLRRPGPFHVGVLLENVPEFVFLLLGAGLAGAAVVGINPTRRGAELARDINHTDCQLIVTDGSMRPLLDGIPLDLTPDRILDIDGPAYARRCSRPRPTRSAAASSTRSPHRIPRRCSCCSSRRARPARRRPCG